MKGVYLARFGAAPRSAVADRGISRATFTELTATAMISWNYSPYFTDAAEATTYREHASDAT